MSSMREPEGVVGLLHFNSPLSPLSHISDAVLKAELSRRKVNSDTANSDGSTCGSGERGAYNTPLHVFALVLILVISTLACSFPIIARRFPRLPIPRRFLFLSRHFGTGVLIATAFVHLLPTAFVSLTDPCLPRFWSTTYRPMPGFVAMISVFAVVTVEMFFTLKGAGHIHGGDYDNLMNDVGHWQEMQWRDHAENYAPVKTNDQSGDVLLQGMGADGNVGSSAPLGQMDHGRNDARSTSSGEGKEDEDLTAEDPELYTDGDPFISEGTSQRPSRPHSHRPHLHHLQGESSVQNVRRQLLQCLLLEAGILFHSIFIGMALSVATGPSFIVLLIAISFHQTFEGFALGARIASLIPELFPASSVKPWLMSLAYGTTTPIGQALGLILHNMYDPGSTIGLLMVGITNAVSSGLLLFAGLVELLAEDFLSESSYETLKGRRRVEACLSVLCGALLMSFVGAFA